MISRPRVSFVVPAYNEERLLPACLAAIRAEIDRSGCDAEILVVNNASTDGTGRIAAATGELIANIDADTLVPPGWLDRVLAEFACSPRLVVLSGPYDYYDVPFHIRAAARLFYAVGFATYVFNKRVLGVGSMVQGGNFVLLRDALAGIGGFSDRFTFYGEDTDIASRMSRVGDVKFTFALMAKSSGRRLQGDGLIMTGVRYSTNYLWATYFRKPFTTAWNDYR